MESTNNAYCQKLIVTNDIYRQKLIMANVIHLLPFIATFLDPRIHTLIHAILHITPPVLSIADLVDFCRSLSVPRDMIEYGSSVYNRYLSSDLLTIERLRDTKANTQYIRSNLSFISGLNDILYYSLINLSILLPHELPSIDKIYVSDKSVDFIIAHNVMGAIDTVHMHDNRCVKSNIMDFQIAYPNDNIRNLFVCNAEYVVYNNSTIETAFIMFTGWRFMRYSFSREEI